MANQKPIKVVFGERYPGDMRVIIGSEDVPVMQVALLPTEQGDIPRLQITMLVPELTIEDHNPPSIPSVVPKQGGSAEVRAQAAKQSKSK